jgi:hypothetical protein
MSPSAKKGLHSRYLLRAAAAKFADALVKVDPAVANASRIWKVYGTLACKGENTAERSHRVARILDSPEHVAVAPAEVLETIAALDKGGHGESGEATEHWTKEALKGVGAGQRNTTCAQLAGYYASKGIPPLRREWFDAQLLPLSLRLPEIVLNLLVEPALRRRVERDRQPHGHLRADSRATVQDRRQRLPAHPERPGDFGDREPPRPQAQLPQNLSGVRRIVHLHHDLT